MSTTTATASLLDRACAATEARPAAVLVGTHGVTLRFHEQPQDLIDAFDLTWVGQLDQWYAVVDGVVLSVAAGYPVAV